VQFQDPPAAGRAVQAVDVLGQHGKAIAQALFQPDQRQVTWVRSCGTQTCTPGIIKTPDQRRIPAEGRGRRHLLDAVALPKSAGPAERGQAALGGDTGARHHGHAAGGT